MHRRYMLMYMNIQGIGDIQIVLDNGYLDP